MASGRGPTTVGGKLGISVFFAIFLTVGLILTGVFARETYRDLRTWRWAATPCTIVESRVENVANDNETPYEFKVRYRYAAPDAAEPLTGEDYARSYTGSDEYRDAQLLVERFPAGSRAECYVDPADAKNSVLTRNSLWGALAVLFPLIFVAIGAGGIWFTWRGPPTALRPLTTTAGIADASGSLTRGASSKAGIWVAVAFFAVFFLIGAGILVGVFVPTLLRAGSSNDWPAVPCVIESSRVRSHSGDSTTYSVDVLYAYEVNGKPYKSSRYKLMGGSSSGYDGKRAVVDRLPRGTKTVCYVNPADPTDAVLERGYTSDLWFAAIPGLFALIGAVGLVFTVRHLRGGRAASARPPWERTGATRPLVFGTGRASAAGAGAEPIVLRTRHSGKAKLLFAIVFAAFWNGIISIFVTQVVRSWQSGSPDYCMTIFMLPFVAVGIGSVGAIGYLFVALFNPRLTFELSRGDVAPGESAEVRWEFTGRYDRIKRLTIRLEGKEEATYRRGTDTKTDRETFASIDLLDTAKNYDIRAGKKTFTVPAGTMHSFDAPNNKIVWSLTVHGEIPLRPDVKEEFVLTVRPAPAARLPAASEGEEGPT